MGTSNWQNIPFCIEALMKIAPARVLDVGVGFGRWGMVVREFCDVWFGRVLQPEWQVRVEGVEGFPDNIRDYHAAFYNHIHRADAREVLPEQFQQPWDVVIFGDVLEHFQKPEARQFLQSALAASDYVLVNIPLGGEWPQSDMYHNPYERHLSEWAAEDFENETLVRAAFFEDYLGRPFGSFILSRDDPKNLAGELFSRRTRLDAAPALTPAQRRLLAQTEQTARELEQIRNTVTWRTYQAIDRSPAGKPLRAMMRVLAAPVRRRWAKQNPAPPQSAPDVLESAGRAEFSAAEERWLAQTRQAQPEAIALLHPEWRGVRSSTLNLFATCYELPEALNETDVERIARLLVETGCRRLVCSGFSETQRRLAEALHRLEPGIRLFVVWYGSFLQSQEDAAWQGFQAIGRLCRQGVIYKWGFAKKGMAEVMAQTGLRTGFVMSKVNRIPDNSSTPLAGGPHLGLWSLGQGWRKPPYAMLAAATLVPGAIVHGSGAGPRLRELAANLKIDATRLDPAVVPQAQMHLNLYVTLSECAPMLPLESLSVGAPCLFGPNSHLFEDNDFLHRSLVVPYPDSSQAIAKAAQQALARRDEIIAAYRDYAPGYNARAQASLAEFLEL